MELNNFIDNIKELSELNNTKYTDEQIEKLFKYMQLLLEWNEKMNLTGITEENDVILKHFIDSTIVSKYLNDKNSLIDIGTGAGFPGLPLKIVNPHLNVTLLDSLNKRINFLNEVISENNIEDVTTIHGRAEEYGQNPEYREKFDVAISRAVASMNVLLEYMMPFVKVGGICICLKSINAEEEVENSKNVITTLGGKLENFEKIYLKDKNGEIIERDIVVIRKKETTDTKYPRNSNKINKKPLV